MGFHKNLNGDDLHAPSRETVVNMGATTISALTCIRFDGFGTANYPTIVPTDGLTQDVHGIAATDLSSSQQGQVACYGLINNVDTSYWETGTILYADSAGNLVSAGNSGGANIQALVLHSHSACGILYKNPSVLISDQSLLATDTAIFAGLVINGSATVSATMTVGGLVVLSGATINGSATVLGDFKVSGSSSFDAATFNSSVNVCGSMVIASDVTICSTLSVLALTINTSGNVCGSFNVCGVLSVGTDVSFGISSIGDVDLTASPNSNQVLAYVSSSQKWQAFDVSALISSFPSSVAISSIDHSSLIGVVTTVYSHSDIDTHMCSTAIHFGISSISASTDLNIHTTATDIHFLFSSVTAAFIVDTHNNLSSIQGGTSSEYYHLDNSQASRTLDVLENLSGICNVTITTPSQNDILMWDSSASGWINRENSGGGAASSTILNLTSIGDVFGAASYSANDVLTWVVSSTGWESKAATGGSATVTNLSSIVDVIGRTYSANDVLTWIVSSTGWEARAGAAAGASATVTNLSSVGDVTTTTPSENDILVYKASSTAWENKSFRSVFSTYSLITATSYTVGISDTYLGLNAASACALITLANPSGIQGKMFSLTHLNDSGDLILQCTATTITINGCATYTYGRIYGESLSLLSIDSGYIIV